MTKLTIVVPVYNAAAYLPQCIESILAQTFRDFTLLLINDGSTDESPKICAQYAAQDPRITLIAQENMGVEQTILKGIRLTTTPLIGFLDSDDWALPTMYETLVTAMEQQGADLVQCGTLINGKTRNPALSSPEQAVFTDPFTEVYRPFFEQSGLLYPITNARWNKVYQTASLQAVLPTLSQGVQIGEDLLMNLAYLRSSKKVLVLAEENLHCYRATANSLSQGYSEKKQTSILKLYPLLTAIAKQESFTDSAVQEQGENETCALILDLLLSNHSISKKTTNLRYLYNRLSNKKHILQYAQQRPFVAKLVLYMIYLRLFKVISVLVYPISRR